MIAKSKGGIANGKVKEESDSRAITLLVLAIGVFVSEVLTRVSSVLKIPLLGQRHS